MSHELTRGGCGIAYSIQICMTKWKCGVDLCGFTVETEPGGMKNRRGVEFYEQLLNLVDNFQIARCTVRCVVL